MIPFFSLFSFASSDFNFKQPPLSGNQCAIVINRGDLRYIQYILTDSRAVVKFFRTSDGGFQAKAGFQPGSVFDKTLARAYEVVYNPNGSLNYISSVSFDEMTMGSFDPFSGPVNSVAFYGHFIFDDSAKAFHTFQPTFSDDNGQVIEDLDQIRSDLNKSSTSIPTVDNSTYNDIQGVEDSLPGIDLNQFKSILHNLDTDSFRQSSAWIWQQVESWTMVSPLVLTFLMVLLTFSLIAYLLRKV